MIALEIDVLEPVVSRQGGGNAYHAVHPQGILLKIESPETRVDLQSVGEGLGSGDPNGVSP